MAMRRVEDDWSLDRSWAYVRVTSRPSQRASLADVVARRRGHIATNAPFPRRLQLSLLFRLGGCSVIWGREFKTSLRLSIGWNVLLENSRVRFSPLLQGWWR